MLKFRPHALSIRIENDKFFRAKTVKHPSERYCPPNWYTPVTESVA